MGEVHRLLTGAAMYSVKRKGGARYVHGQKRDALRDARQAVLIGGRPHHVYEQHGKKWRKIASVRVDTDGRGVETTWHRPALEVKY